MGGGKGGERGEGGSGWMRREEKGLFFGVFFWSSTGK